jgi:hypothetical protein
MKLLCGKYLHHKASERCNVFVDGETGMRRLEVCWKSSQMCTFSA